MAETRFTRLGCELFYWAPFVALDDSSQILWLTLYASSAAKRLVPGLWHGGIGTITDATPRWTREKTVRYLDTLIERRMVEFDQHSSVLRLTQLPDAGERAHNPQALAGWWSRFLLVPACRVRDAHVNLLRWMLEQGHISDTMREGWVKTFGTVKIPSSDARPQLLSSSDTSTKVQPSLFASPALPSESDQQDPGSGAWSAHPCLMDAPTSGLGSGSGSGLGSGSGSGHAHTALGMGDTTTPAPTPTLTVVPPFTPEQLLAALAEGFGPGVASAHAVVRETQRAALQATIRDLDARGIPLTDVSAAGKWARLTTPTLSSQWPSCHPDELLCMWASQPGAVASAITRAREHDKVANERAQMLRELQQVT